MTDIIMHRSDQSLPKLYITTYTETHVAEEKRFKSLPTKEAERDVQNAHYAIIPLSQPAVNQEPGNRRTTDNKSEVTNIPI